MAIGKVNSQNIHLERANKAQSSAFAKLSSGLRITKAKDDAAGLAIAEQLRVDQATLRQAANNIDYGRSALEMMDSTLAQVGDITGRMAELATQAANGTLSAEQRNALDAEYQQLNEELGRIADSTSFNNRNVFDGEEIVLQVGNDSERASQLTVAGVDVQAIRTSLAGDIKNQENARAMLEAAQNAVGDIAKTRATIGATMSQLNTAVNNNLVARENLAAAESRIRDVDVAAETANLTNANIRGQISAALSAQANQNAGRVVGLLKG